MLSITKIEKETGHDQFLSIEINDIYCCMIRCQANRADLKRIRNLGIKCQFSAFEALRDG
jgi:hypothetical protein